MSPFATKAVALAALLLAARAGEAQASFATKVHAYQPGPGAAAPYDDPKKALGPILGAGRTSGSLDVVTLGEGGSLTLGFDTPITDGPGADFIVFENAFMVGLDSVCYAELAFVEVSSNGIDFARFPLSYVGPQSALGPFGALVPGSWAGFAGTTPVHAHASTRPDIDPRDPARAGGDAFDLAVLRDHPLAKLGRLNPFRITHVRLVDVVDGKHRDTKGRLIRDPSAGSADIEGICVINRFGKPSARRPVLELTLTSTRHIRYSLGDPDGLADLLPKRLGFSIQGDALDLGALLAISRFVSGDDKLVVFETAFSLPPDFPLVVALSATDQSGAITGASLHLH